MLRNVIIVAVVLYAQYILNISAVTIIIFDYFMYVN